jgi:hypothetical protein
MPLFFFFSPLVGAEKGAQSKWASLSQPLQGAGGEEPLFFLKEANPYPGLGKIWVQHSPDTPSAATLCWKKMSSGYWKRLADSMTHAKA